MSFKGNCFSNMLQTMTLTDDDDDDDNLLVTKLSSRILITYSTNKDSV